MYFLTILFQFSDSNDSTSFSALHKNINLFSNEFNDLYPDTDFLFRGNQLLGIQSTSETGAKQFQKLIEKTRENIRQLGIYVKVHDPSKMLNILVMAQQLLCIDPPPPVVEVIAPKTIVDILKVPTAARTKRVRNKKLSFGIMSDNEIVRAVDELVEDERELNRRTESEK